MIANEPKAIPGGSKQKQKQRRLKKLWRDYQPRAQKYEEYQALFKGRNSFSKTDHFGKQFLISYTTYEKEQKRKYRHDPTKLDNWYYDETEQLFKAKPANEFMVNARLM